MNKVKLTINYSLPPLKRRNIGPEEEEQETYPLLPIILYCKGKKTPPIEGLVDSGSDGLFIPRRIADFLGLERGAPVQSTGVDGAYDAFRTDVGIVIGRGGKDREADLGIIEATVPANDKDVPVLIGRHPIFDEYQIIFEEYKKRFIMNPKEKAL